MRRHSYQLSALLAFASMTISCSLVEPLPVEVSCEAEPICQVASNPLQRERLQYNDELRIFGSCQHPDGVAIRTLYVAGKLVANPNDRNFDEWELNLEYNYVASLEDADGLAVLPIIAMDACGQTTEVAKLSFELPLDARIDVQEIDLAIGYPKGEDGAAYLPASGSVLGVAEVTANEAAAGATVKLESSGEVRFVEPNEGEEVADPNSTSVVLARSDGKAVGRVVMYGHQEGTGTITASANDRQDFKLIKVAGPPEFVINGDVALPPDAAARIDVTAECTLDTCWATPEPGFDVFLTRQRSRDLMAGPVRDVDDSEEDNRLSITVVSRTEDPDASVSVLCVDIFGQSQTTEFRGAEGPVEDEIDPSGPGEPDPKDPPDVPDE